MSRRRRMLDRKAARAAVAGVVLAAAAACGTGGPRAEPAAPLRAALRSLGADSTLRLPTGDTLHVSATTARFYAARAGRPAWVDSKTLTSQGRKLRKAMQMAPTDGLSPDVFRVPLADSLVARLEGDPALKDSAKARLLAGLDVVLTEGLNRYASDLVRGTMDPARAGLDWRIPREPAPGPELAAKVVGGADPGSVLAALRPATPYYGRMRAALQRFRRLRASGGWPVVPETGGGLAAGDSSALVAAVRARLAAGDDPREAALALAGARQPYRFDAKLAEALRHFQDRNGIADDGALGPTTREELNRTVEDRISDLELNMDRWRWLPRRLGDRFILVNVAGFELNVVEHDRPVEAMNVVVGKQGWQTPIFADTMEYLIVNPYWNVPESIEKEEILPKLASDPGYLERNHFEVDRNGHTVSPASVDFTNLGNYRIRQKPGRWNALGQLKFMFPNHDNIYLHDTPADHLFSREERAFSHGCIRLQHPKRLARLLMARVTNESPSSLDSLIEGGREHWVRFTQGVPVYILYFTAWVDEDGTVRFYHDVYGRDAKLAPQQQRVQSVAESRTASAPTPRG